jgi:prepilin-type N-terminal cleavage/methylation domain-containing protein
MKSDFGISLESGFTLIEALVTLSMLAVIAASACLSGSHVLDRQDARGAAQLCQAASALAQSEVLWSGGSRTVGYSAAEVSIRASSGAGMCDSEAPATAVSANVPRWCSGAGISWSFGGTFASPDGGGSLYFGTGQNRYRVAIRPESGLTTRELDGDE